MMSGGEIAIIATIVPTGGGILGMLYRMGNLMGRIEEKLGSHDDRLAALETVLPRSAQPPRNPPYPLAPHRTT